MHINTMSHNLYNIKVEINIVYSRIRIVFNEYRPLNLHFFNVHEQSHEIMARAVAS